MKRKSLWLIVIVTLFSILVNLPSFGGFGILGQYPLKLGLDLLGGTQLVLQTQMEKINPQERDQALESAREVIERRVNLFGVSESIVQSSKIGNTRRILVDLPGIKDASAAANLVGKTAQLEFRELVGTPSAKPEEASAALLPIEEINLQNTKETTLTGSDLKRAQVTFGGSSGQARAGPQVNIQFNPEGSKEFAEITKRNVGKQLPIFLDEVPISAPVVNQEIIGGDAVITGNFTLDEAKRLSIQLNAGALPVPIKIIEQRSIGASLGAESIQKSIVAAIIGLITVMVFMVAYYGYLGLIANFALILYTLFVAAIFRTGLFVLPPVTLTLAGIAGFILSIGMAVDANILIFERMKEEKRWGKTNLQALELGFRRAWSSIKDSNVSSLITAAILYFIGTGVVRGFALTLAIGVLVSMFTAILVTKTFLKILIKK